MGAVHSDDFVSIIIPSYNRQEYLGATLFSCQAQTWPHWEVIVVDDGSTDGSAAIAEAVAQKDSRFRVIRTENRGPCAARNLGLSQSRGHWIKFLDHDDLLTSEALERFVLAARRHDAALVCGKSRGFWSHELSVVEKEANLEQASAARPNQPGSILEFDSPYILCVTQYPTFNEILVAREVLESVGGYEERLLSADEFNLFMRISLYAPQTPSLVMLSPPVLLKRYLNDSLAVQARTQKTVSWPLRSLSYVAEYYFVHEKELPPTPPKLKRYLFDELYNQITNGYRHQWIEDSDVAWKLWKRAQLSKPLMSPWYHHLLHRVFSPRRVEQILRGLRMIRDRSKRLDSTEKEMR